jgi:hypothetical protein
VDARERDGGDANLFGPSVGELRELADRAVDRTLGQVERKAADTTRAYAAKAALYGVVGCAAVGVSGGCVLGLLAGLLKLVPFAREWKRNRRRAGDVNRMP